MFTFFSLVVGIAVCGVANSCSVPCPYPWKSFEGNCYGLFQQSLTFDDAERECKAKTVASCDGGDVLWTAELASIHSSGEQSFLVDYVHEQLGTTTGWDPQVYIGILVGSSNGEQSWTDGSSVPYTAWYAGEPNNGPDSRGVIAAGDYAGGNWADVPSWWKFYYMCKLPCVEYRV